MTAITLVWFAARQPETLHVDFHFCIGLLFGNLNAIAMQPLGHIAGVGAAVVGSLSTLVSVPLGILVGQCYDGTVLPLVAGFALFGTAALIAVGWTERYIHCTISLDAVWTQ